MINGMEHQPPRWVDQAGAAEYLSVNPETIRRLAVAGTITRYTIGTKIRRYDLNELDALLISSAPPPGPTHDR